MKRYKLSLHKAVVPDKPLLDTPKERKGFLHFTAVLDVDDETVDTFFQFASCHKLDSTILLCFYLK